MEDILAWLIFKPFTAFWQAIVGMLYPTTSPDLIRAKQTTAIFILLGVCAMPVAPSGRGAGE